MIARGKSSVEFSKVFLRSSAAISGPKEKKVHLANFLIIVMMILIVEQKIGNKQKFSYKKMQCNWL